MTLALTPKAIALITSFEGFDQPGRWPGAASGVTIGIGYDLGYYTEAQFCLAWGALLPAEHIERLAHAIGLKGGAARSYASRLTDIHIPTEAGRRVFAESTLPDFAARAARAFPGAELLPEDAQGALVSLVFNRGTAMDGDRRREMANIRAALQNQGAAPANLLSYIATQIRAMKRLWQGQGLDGLLRRRDAEADLVESCIAR